MQGIIISNNMLTHLYCEIFEQLPFVKEFSKKIIQKTRQGISEITDLRNSRE